MTASALPDRAFEMGIGSSTEANQGVNQRPVPWRRDKSCPRKTRPNGHHGANGRLRGPRWRAGGRFEVFGYIGENAAPAVGRTNRSDANKLGYLFGGKGIWLPERNTFHK